MKEKAWPSLRSCKSLRRTGAEEEYDRLSQLPDEVLLSIMSRLTIKEAAITSVVSHRWNQLWACYPGIMSFEDYFDVSMTKEERRAREARLSQDTCSFVRWVTHVVEQHVGPSPEEFKVAFDLDNTYQSHIDKWMVFALAKGVKSLVLDFNARLSVFISRNFYTMPLQCCMALKSPNNCPSSLKTLVLSDIDITTEVVECFLQSCPSLETLHIRCSMSLGSIKAACSPLALKHLDVSGSPRLEIIDILAPKLVTFSYIGRAIQLNIRNAISLSEVSVGCNNSRQPLAYALDSLSVYFSQLEYLNLRSCLNMGANVVIPPVSNLTNLKHLRLTIDARSCQSLFGWITLIEASPVLQKFTLELSTNNQLSVMTLEKRTSPRPLGCLRTLELYGFVGVRIDVELVEYVFENAVVLEEVIIDFKVFGRLRHSKLHNAREKVMELKEKLRLGAKLIINE